MSGYTHCGWLPAVTVVTAGEVFYRDGPRRSGRGTPIYLIVTLLAVSAKTDPHFPNAAYKTASCQPVWTLEEVCKKRVRVAREGEVGGSRSARRCLRQLGQGHGSSRSLGAHKTSPSSSLVFFR